jgi:MoxR-like ATPase
VVGRDAEVDLLLISFLARGHVLIEGVPGISKTLLARAFARCLGLEFRRIQFTPDMLPMDMVGGFVFSIENRVFEFRRGPIFTNVVLADEINRAPPKVQSALLEAMQERQATVEGHTELLPDPFLVIATQNPLEFQGVYPLPEGQLDRFLMKIELAYPDPKTESEIITRNLGDMRPETIDVVLEADELTRVFKEVQKVRISGDIIDYISRVAQETRLDKRLSLGASPRSMVHLTHGARANAYLEGRGFVTPDDVKKLSNCVLAHRVKLNQAAVLAGTASNPAEVVGDIFARVRPPR